MASSPDPRGKRPFADADEVEPFTLGGSPRMLRWDELDEVTPHSDPAVEPTPDTRGAAVPQTTTSTIGMTRGAALPESGLSPMPTSSPPPRTAPSPPVTFRPD